MQGRTWVSRAAVLIIVACLGAGPVRSQEGPSGSRRPGTTSSPYFVVAGGEGGGDGSIETFPLKSTDVVANVSGVIADVLVTQRYRNEGTRPINARYVFPGSTRASIHGMRIRIGDHVVVAKIKEREKARQEFEQAKSQGKSASLLEQQRPNVFTMSVANILPQELVEVELHYSELLVPTAGTYEFVYPAVVAPRYSGPPEPDTGMEAGWAASPFLHEGTAATAAFSVSVVLSTGIPIQELRSPSHEIDVAWEGGSRATATLADRSGEGGDRDFILDYRLAGSEIQSGLLLHEGEKENFFLLMVQPPDRVRGVEIPPREYIFVLDVSGSMQGFPLDTAKLVIRDLIAHLRETDRFNVVLFSGDSRLMAPASIPANEANVERAMQVIETPWGGGGTELVPAMKSALALPRREDFSRTIVVITDGFITAERETFEVIEKNLNRTNFFCFGIGSGVNRYLVEGIARAGAGEPFVVTQPSEAAEAARRFREYIQSPVLTDVHVRFDGFDAYDVEPPSLPDLFAERPIVLFGKWRGKAEGEIEVSGQGGLRPYSRTFRVGELRSVEGNAALSYLWARSRVARLSDFNAGQDDPQIAAQITSLGLEYSLLTRHTSFIAVLEIVRNPDEAASDVDQPQPLPRGVSEMAVGTAFQAGPEPDLWIVGALAGSLILILAFRKRRGSPGTPAISGREFSEDRS